MILLGRDSYSNIKCINCNQGFEIAWLTEYGDATERNHKIKCLDCNYDQIVNVKIHTIYTIKEIINNGTSRD